MATEKDDPRQAAYSAASREGVKALTRRAKRSDASRAASRTVWDAQWIGVIHGYPKTAEAFEARRERGRAHFARLRAEGYSLTRLGVPDGWAGMKPEIAKIKRAAKRGAIKEVDKLIESGTVLDEESAHGALRVAFQLILDDTQQACLRIQAIKVVSAFLKPKPQAKVSVEVSPAEQWLLALHTATAESAS